MQLFVKVSGNTLSVFIKKTSIVHDLKVELARSSGKKTIILILFVFVLMTLCRDTGRTTKIDF